MVGAFRRGRGGGSSPRVRGRPAERVSKANFRGLIPACAGQTSERSDDLFDTRAHPRVCGADTFGNGLPLRPRGSSPRVRGRRLPTAPPHGGTGLIPACAGQTSPPKKACPAQRAHPRVCGADFELAGVLLKSTGSSPRVRGRLGGVEVSHWLFRLIPACAGQTWFNGGPYGGHTAHPRVCGADRRLICSPRTSGGSSPRVRGRQRGEARQGRHHRLIPACAGQTK